MILEHVNFRFIIHLWLIEARYLERLHLFSFPIDLPIICHISCRPNYGVYEYRSFRFPQVATFPAVVDFQHHFVWLPQMMVEEYLSKRALRSHKALRCYDVVWMVSLCITEQKNAFLAALPWFALSFCSIVQFLLCFLVTWK